MLVSFSVQNHRSFASRQTMSLVAGVGAKRQKRRSFPSGNSLAPHLLRSACLFGPNGAGKSALVSAFNFYHNFVVSSAKDAQEGEKIDVSPFKLDKKWKEQPTEFEATFIHGNALYQYGFSVDTDRVWGEWLFSKPNASDKKIRTLFQREYNSKENSYDWQISKTNVRGKKEVWKNSTRDNALFLSTAIQLKAEIFKEPFDWIQKFLRVVMSPDRLAPSFTSHQCIDEGWKDKVLNLLQAADLSVKDLNIGTGEINLGSIPLGVFSENTREVIRKEFEGRETYIIKFSHKSTNGKSVLLDFDEESDGSQVIFGIAGPWLDVLENGYTLVIDELHNSLHPHALRFLVNMFHDPRINKNNAQLIFTSHETSVMAKGFMLKDQVWLVEKNESESSRLFPLSDYKVRDISDFQKAYLDGRYGAVPKLKEFVGG